MPYQPTGDLPRRIELLDLVLTQAPGVPPLALDDVKQHLRVDFDDDDPQIQAYIDAIVGQIDGFTGFLGRCLVEQQWCWYFERFPRLGDAPVGGSRDWRELALPLSPLIAVDSVAYTDPNGNAQALDMTTVVVRTGPRASISLRQGQFWPQTSGDPRAVALTFRAGYAAKGSAEGPVPGDVPAGIRAAMKLMIGDLYENRQAVVVAESRVTQILNPTANQLLASYRSSWL